MGFQLPTSTGDIAGFNHQQYGNQIQVEDPWDWYIYIYHENPPNLGNLDPQWTMGILWESASWVEVLEFMDDFAEALGLDLLQRETLLHHLGVEDAELIEAKKVVGRLDGWSRWTGNLYKGTGMSCRCWM